MSQNNNKVPAYHEMFIPTLKALQQLGGSGSAEEIYKRAVEIQSLPPEVLTVPHGATSQTEVAYRLAWARTYLKTAGYISNPSRSVWALLIHDINADQINVQQIVQQVRENNASKKAQNTVSPSASTPVDLSTEASDIVTVDTPEEIQDWRIRLYKVLIALSPAAFERLAQRLLRESGFIEVEVTGKTNDGGIDGIGIARVSGFLSFRVLFQCKRYQGSVTPSQIRDFRGAMTGRTDKGLFITTGTFTREAVKEATRDGAPPIDLIDGEQLVQRLKDLNLGVAIKMVEAVDVDEQWFRQL